MGGALANAFVTAERDFFGHQAHHRIKDTGDHRDRRYLGLKQSGILRRNGSLLAAGTVLVHALTRNGVALGHQLSRLQHAPVNLWLVLRQPAVLNHVFVHFLLHARDALDPTRHKNISFTRDDPLRGQGDRLQAG